MSYCNQKKIAVVPQGGNTGLVGGSVPVHDEIVVSLNKMNKVVAFDKTTSVVTVEAGCILEALNSYLKDYNCEVPVDLAAKAVQLYQDATTWLQAQKNGVEIINQRYLRELFEEDFAKQINFLVLNIKQHRLNNFMGELLQHHTLKSTKYMSKWIEEKNR